MIPAIVILSESALPTALRIRDVVGGEVHGLAKRVTAEVTFDDTKAHVQSLFTDATPIIAVMASGALIRLLAPLLSDKKNEPPVVAIADDGSAVVPLLGGHHGANDLARVIADALDVSAAVTTAGDVKFGVALDEPPAGYTPANPHDAKAFMADLVAGATVRLELSHEGCPPSVPGGASLSSRGHDGLVCRTTPQVGRVGAWLLASQLPFDKRAEHRIVVTHKAIKSDEKALVYHPRNLVLGIGCERGASFCELRALIEETLAENHIAKESLSCVCSIDLKADETAINEAARWLGVPFRVFNAGTLEAQTPRLKNPSDIVFAEVGCHGVAEGSALAAVGVEGKLIVEKTKSERATCAVTQAPDVMTEMPGRARGTLFVVGIGPGSDEWRSPQVTRMVGEATDLVGYSLYLDLLGDLVDGKALHDFALGKEEDRVRHAMELAGEGKTVALVCSGDAGIYAMATLVYELIAKDGISDAAKRIEVINAPGISALQAAAARSGAPLGHDFCTISLSDLLTPWEDIQRRVRAAGEGDFVIAFYNPVSKKRRTQLAWARDELLNYRPIDTPVVLATNLGREGEAVRIVPLYELQVDDVDMLTVVVVGSSDSRTVKTGDGGEWIYTPRGYSGKATTEMKQ